MASNYSPPPVQFPDISGLFDNFDFWDTQELPTNPFQSIRSFSPSLPSSSLHIPATVPDELPNVNCALPFSFLEAGSFHPGVDQTIAYLPRHRFDNESNTYPAAHRPVRGHFRGRNQDAFPWAPTPLLPNPGPDPNQNKLAVSQNDDDQFFE